MLITVIPVLVMVAGILCWALSSNQVVRTAGTIMFAAGVFVLTASLAKVSWRVGQVVGEPADVTGT